MLVGMSISQQLSLGVGFKIYVLTYYTMKNPQSIIIFLNDVKTTMSDPRKSKLPMKLYNVVYEKRFIIGVGIASFALGNYLKGGELKYAVQECSKYMPQNEIVRNIFLEIRHFSGMIGFMISSILGEFRKGLWSGVFDGVPAVIKDFFKMFLKNVPQEVIKDATKK